MLHPIVAQMEPSVEQEPAITTRDCDILVTAGAGTGKTRTLVARYLSLLADGLPLRSLVAITFTRKAAREMRNRVRAAIQQYIGRLDLSPAERERWQSLYPELDAARIDTIHGLCTEILRAHPAEARVDPRFAVLDEGQAHLLHVLALDEALAWAANDAQAAGLFVLLGERELRRNLDQLLRRRLDAAEVLAHLPEDITAHWRSLVAKHQQEVLLALQSRPEWAESVRVLRGNPADRSDDRAEVCRRRALAAVDGATGSLEKQMASLCQLKAISLRGGSKKAWPGGVEQLREVKAALRTVRALWEQEDPSRWSFLALDEELAMAFPVLRVLVAFAWQRYAALKQERNAMDFDDLEQGALQLLQQNGALRAYWQEQVRAILVDEFQDTNGRQRDLVTLLNGGQGKLFAVGDAKQSIYRFRGADVTVFRAERQRIQREGGQVFPLEVSYRAHRELIQGLNDLLRPVLGEQEDPAQPWVEPFAPLKHYREEPGPGFCAPHLELHLTVGSKGSGALDRAADALAARLVHWVESGRYRVGRDGFIRALAYDDVAILCRASSSFPAYEDALERAGIPFLTVAGGGFYQRPEIRDLLNAMQTLADPTDDLALVGLLRSPAFAVSDVELYRLCQERKQDNRNISLWDILCGAKGQFRSEAGQRAAQIIADLHRWAGRTSVADLLKALLDATDYRAALIQAGETRAARNVSKLLADAHASAIVGVGAFLEYVQGLRDAAAREGEARTPAEGVVQIMSVHQAKGLEFPVVVIGDVTYGGGRGGSGLLIDPELGLLLPKRDEDKNLPAVYRLGQVSDKAKEAAEEDRLLYVAATRAREKLVLSGCFAGRLPARSWLGRIASSHELAFDVIPGYDPEGARALTTSLDVGQTALACTIYEPKCTWDYAWREAAAASFHSARRSAIQVQPALTTAPPLLAAVLPGQEWADQRTVEAERDPPQRVWRVVPASPESTAPAWVIGKLVHEALASWRFPDEGFERWAEARARGYGLTDGHQLHDAVVKSRRLLERFVRHDLFQEMDRAERLLHEVPYHIQTDDHPESGIIDALYLRDGRWTVVEFKTDQVRDALALRTLLRREDYLGQVRRYAAATERLLGQRPRVIMCMLNYANSVRLVEEDVQA